MNSNTMLRYLSGLAANNNREWYHAHKAEYQELSKLPNIGKRIEEQLIQAGIKTADDVKKDLKEFYQWHKK